MDYCLVFYAVYGFVCVTVSSLLSFAACLREEELQNIYSGNKTPFYSSSVNQDTLYKSYLNQPFNNHVSKEKKLPPVAVKKPQPQKWLLENDKIAIMQLNFLEENSIPHPLAVEIISALHEQTISSDRHTAKLNQIMNTLLTIYLNSPQKNSPTNKNQ